LEVIVSAKQQIRSAEKTQDAKSQQTDLAQFSESGGGAEAVREGMAPRHEPASGEERDSLHDNSEHTEHGDETHHIISFGTYLAVFSALMVLLVMTLVVYFFMDLSQVWGPANIIVAMIIAVAKALLVIMFFMHVKFSSKLTWLFSGAGFLFVLIMFTLTMNDYLTRGILDTAGH